MAPQCRASIPTPIPRHKSSAEKITASSVVMNAKSAECGFQGTSCIAGRAGTSM